MSASKDPISDIKQALDIVEFISQYLPLKKAGINYMGRCPFHDEKTPSFAVSPERQTFKCFGCGKGGDIFSFVVEKEGIEFKEALKLLASRAGVELPERASTNSSSPTTSLKSRLFELNETCANLWHQLLLKHDRAEVARNYLKKERGLTDQVIKDFRLGWAPPTHTTILALTKRGFSENEIRQAGEPQRFAGRITYPLADITGRIVGFTGRQLPVPEADARGPLGPKYWNTPETPIFRKSESLYGLHLAKDTMRKTGATILAEGQMDVIGLHLVGLTQAVASSGTALTDQQLNIISRFSSEIVFAYDADQAGQEAAQRGFILALRHDLNPTVMPLPSGEDPGSLAKKKPDQLVRAYDNRQPVVQWILDIAIKDFGITQPGSKKRVVKQVLPWVARVTDAVERRAWLDLMAEKIGTSTTALEEELNKLKKEPSEPVNLTPTVTLDALILLMGVLGQHPSLLPNASNLDRLVKDSEWEPVYAHLSASPQSRSTLERDALSRLNEAVLIAQHEYGSLSLPELKQEVENLSQRLVLAYNRAIREKLNALIAKAEEENDKTALNALMEQLRTDTI